MARRRNRARVRRAQAAAKHKTASPSSAPAAPPSSSAAGSSSGGATDQSKAAPSGVPPHPEGDAEVWTHSERLAIKRRLLDIIHRFYLDAISRLPPAELRRTAGLARGLLVGGHCFGPLHPIHNIVVNSIWYAAAFPLNTDAEPDDDDDDEVRALLSTDGLARIVHRSLHGLLAALRRLCPSLSTGEAALWKLFSAGADLTAAVALANGTSTSSALRVISSRGRAAFHAAADVARHPNPTSFSQFASSVLPPVDVEQNVVQLLLRKHVLATRHINYLSILLVPSPPHEPPQSPSPLLLSPQVLDWIASEKKKIKDTGKQVINVVNMALQDYTLRSGEQLMLHSVCGASLLKEEGLDDCYHINFLAYHTDSGSAVGSPVLFFTEAVVLSNDETDIRQCVPVDLVTDIGCCFACEINRKKLVHPIYDEYLGGREFQVDEIDYGSDFPTPLDVDFIFFDADRNRAFEN